MSTRVGIDNAHLKGRGGYPRTYTLMVISGLFCSAAV